MTSQFPRLFVWHVVRYARKHRLLALLNVLSVALGIAVYLAIQIANHSANRSFAAGIDLVAGKSHLEVRGAVDETLWPLLARQPGVHAVTGIVEGVVTLPDFPGEYLRVLGIDILSSEPFRTFDIGEGGRNVSLEPWLGTGDGIAVSTEFARHTGLKTGDRLKVLVDSRVRTLTILSLLDTRDSAASSQSRIAAMDIGWAQELLGKTGRLSSLQLLLDDPDRAPAIAAALQPLLPADLTIAPPQQRGHQVQTMLSAFQLNLTALSMVSLLVGVFLIYNTVSASVARRRREIGILRSLGTTRWEVRWLFLGEACLFGVPGIILGMIGGVALARVLTGAVAQTISSLYVLLSIERNFLDPVQFIVAAIFGLGAVLVGAWIPADDAARVDPAAALSLGAQAERSQVRARGWGWLGSGLLFAAAVCAWVTLHFGPPLLGFVSAFFILTGFALFSPPATRAFGLFAASRIRAGVLWRMAADNLYRSIHRNAVTVASLATAVAMMTGLTVMIFSFRQSVSNWVDRGIVADLFIAPASNETIGLSAAVPAEAVAWLRARPEVEETDTFRESSVPVRIRREAATPVLMAVVEGTYRHNLSFVGGDDDRKAARVFGQQAIAVSEPFARRFRVGDGDKVGIATPGGFVEFEITGVYSDYTRDQGVILMDHGNYIRHWPPALAQSLSIYLHPGTDAEALAEAFRLQFSRAGEYHIYSNGALRQRIFAIFDQTFAITYILRTVAVIVAIAGIFLSITTLVAEREREIGVLRAVGASQGQIRGLLVVEAGMIGLIATALGMASGVVLAMTLTWVVNPAFFGWTIHLQFPWAALVTTPLWIIPATLLAAWFPASQAARMPIATSVREE